MNVALAIPQEILLITSLIMHYPTRDIVDYKSDYALSD